MPAEDRKPAKLESQPIRPISMPEYRYQEYVVVDHYASADRSGKETQQERVDLKDICLNFG